eukprot:GHVQ01023290.1.p1 GENE.GHVQ01023290.1~~GHVQ01023290.1.p1  ORF type:complete len:138 (+),score=16.89 GHVQ01023290.1:119-532(+)
MTSMNKVHGASQKYGPQVLTGNWLEARFDTERTVSKYCGTLRRNSQLLARRCELEGGKMNSCDTTRKQQHTATTACSLNWLQWQKDDSWKSETQRQYMRPDQQQTPARIAAPPLDGNALELYRETWTKGDGMTFSRH